MTCNPAIATCPGTATLWTSTATFANGLCAPVAPETAMCSSYADGAADVPWSDVSPRGALGYFRPAPAADVSHCEAGALPPMDQDLPLAAYRSELPAELAPSIAPLLQLEANFGVPVSFRITSVRLSTGETIPQILFFRTGEGPVAPSAPRAGGGRASTPPPETPTTIGSVVSFAGGAALVVAYDRLLLRPLIEHHLMPRELHSPVLFSSLMVTHAALYRAGIVRTAPGAAMANLPLFMGFQVLAGLLLHEMGVEDGAGRDLATIGLASLPFFLSRFSPMLAEALANSGRFGLLELETLSSGAATLRIGAVFARALGWLGVIDIGMRTVTWATSHPIALMDEALGEGGYEDNLRSWNLTMMSHDIINQEDCGAFLAGAFGMFMMVADGGLVMVDGEYEDYLMDRRGRIQRDLVEGSDEFGRSMHASLASILYRHISVTRGETPGSFRTSVNWEGIRSDIETFYENVENEEAIAGGYELVDDATGHRTRSGIEGLIEVVSEDGEIADLGGFREHMRNRMDREIATRTREHHDAAIRLGLAERVGGVLVYRSVSPDSGFTEAQRRFLDEEGLALATEISFLTFLRQALIS